MSSAARDLLGRLHERRRQAGVSAETLAHAMNLSTDDITALESNERQPTAEILAAMIAALRAIEGAPAAALNHPGMEDAASPFDRTSIDAARFDESRRLMFDFAAILSARDRARVLDLAAKLALAPHE